MAAKILKIVKECADCPNKSYSSGGRYECAAVEQPLVQGHSIPAWCPLPDHPAAIVAPAQARLADARAIVRALDQEVRDGADQTRIAELTRMAVDRLGG